MMIPIGLMIAIIIGGGGGGGYSFYEKEPKGILAKLPWKDIANSNAYARYRKFGDYLYQLSGGLHKPLNEHGDKISIPSKSKQMHKPLPKSIQDCRSLKPIKVRGLVLRNAVIRAASFDGEKLEQIKKVHGDMAKYGVGLTVLAYCAISHDGKSFAHQTVLDEESIPKLRAITNEVHKYGGAIACQLVHAGSFADRTVTKKQQVSASAHFNLAGCDFPREATKQDMEELLNAYESAAKLAIKAGFDAVEVHVGHGYLLSQWISPYTNFRNDEHGGSPKNRAKFPAECIRRVRKAVGEAVPILVKMNMSDGYAGGLELPDALEIADVLADAGTDILVGSGGSVTRSAPYLLRGGWPVEKLIIGMPTYFEKVALALFAPFAVPVTPFDPCFFRDSARALQKRVGHKVHVCYLGGINSLGNMEGAMEEGFSFIQIARLLIREPDFLERVKREYHLALSLEENTNNNSWDIESKCIRCNICVSATVDPQAEISCPFRDLEEKNGLSILNQEDSRILLPDIEDLKRIDHARL